MHGQNRNVTLVSGWHIVSSCRTRLTGPGAGSWDPVAGAAVAERDANWLGGLL